MNTVFVDVQSSNLCTGS